MGIVFTVTRRAPGAFASFFLAILIAGCGEKTVDPPSTKLTDADAAALFAAVLGSGSGGYMEQLEDAVAIAHGGELPSRPENRKGPAIAREVFITRNRSVPIDGATYAYSHRIRCDIHYTSGISIQRDNYYQGNKEIRLMDSIYLGTMNIPTMSAADSGWSLVHLYDTDAGTYHLQGRIYRYGTYTIPGTNRTFKGRIETTTLIPGVDVDPTTSTIVNGNIDMALKGTDAAGNLYEASGVYKFRTGQQAQLSTNSGNTYLLDTRKGLATLRK